LIFTHPPAKQNLEWELDFVAAANEFLETKSRIRKDFLRRLKLSLSTGQKADWDQEILAKTRETLLTSNPRPRHVGLYYAMSSEPDLRALVEEPDLHFAFPRIHGECLEFLQFTDFADFKAGAFSALEPHPVDATPVAVNQLDAVILPGVAFDSAGGRLGRGKGYYDRTLADFKGLRIGVAYSDQCSEDLLPRESHDVPMDVVITEKFKISRKDRA
jgi:5,10-methenyltetrahydrofolate synthetase